MGRGAVLVGGGDDGGGRSGGRDGSMGSGGPGMGRNPSKGENLRGLQERPRQSQSFLSLARNTGIGPQTATLEAPVTDLQGLGSHSRQKLEASPKEELGQSSPKVLVCAPEPHPSHMPALLLST